MSKFNPEETRVDLGEDLLEPTRRIDRPKQDQSNDNCDKEKEIIINDELQRGQILFNERLFEDAKKVFQKVLRVDSENTIAQQYLEDIQQYEIQELLSTAGERKKVSLKNEEDDGPTQVLSRLDHDLRLNLDNETLKIIPTLFESEEKLKKYIDSVMSSVLALCPRERIDVGIAHFEMGLYQVAVEVFETVVRYQDFRIEGMYLLGLALIKNGKAVEATIKIEPFARDLTLPDDQKADFLYLMGMAFESLGDTKRAREFYRRVNVLNPKYRNVQEKIKKVN